MLSAMANLHRTFWSTTVTILGGLDKWMSLAGTSLAKIIDVVHRHKSHGSATTTNLTAVLVSILSCLALVVFSSLYCFIMCLYVQLPTV
jgi:hypothetical protein